MPLLDETQILQKVLNNTEDRLRVAIDQTTDSIKIGDGTDLLVVNPDGSTNVNIQVAGIQIDPRQIRTLTSNDTISVNNFPVSQSVTIASLPLPSGASTETTLSSLNNKVTTVNTGAVVIASSVLPSGASSSALQTATNTSLGSIDNKLTSPLSIVQIQKTSSYCRYGDITTSAITTVPIRRTSLNLSLSTDTGVFLTSSSANDSGSGTGAQKIRVTYYLQSGSGPFTFDATMNGATGVGTPALSYIEKLEVIQVGSGGTTSGTIFMSIFSPLTNVTSMNPGETETFFCHHFVPLGKTSYITGITISHTGIATGNGGLFNLKKQSLPLSSHPLTNALGTIHLTGTNGTINVIFPTPVAIVGPAYFIGYVTPDATTTNTYFSSINLYDI